MRAMNPRLLLALLVPLATGAAFVSCGATDFDPQSLVNSVRIFAARADKPYAAPGETVNLEVFAFDGRPDKRREMKISWLPFVCKNPRNDAYYGCFLAAGQPQDGGAPAAGDAGGAGGMGMGMGGGLAALRPGVDLTPFLPSGSTYAFTMPADAITSHKEVKGASDKYGLAILFDIACAGHLELVERDPSTGPQSVPIGCFDEDHNRLGAADYVLGFTRVYAYETRKNANPVIEKLTFEGKDVDPRVGIKMDHCTKPTRTECPELKLDVVVADASWEVNPTDAEAVGTRHEQLWAAYHADIGQIQGDARLLYDALKGKVPGTETKYQAPSDPGDGQLFVVVHDNRGGAAWVTIPLHVR